MKSFDFDMLRKLCGDEVLKNIAVVTNRWGEVDPKIGEVREADLAREDIPFKPVLDEGARMVHHDDTPQSAEKIIPKTLENPPLASHTQEDPMVTSIHLYQGEMTLMSP